MTAACAGRVRGAARGVASGSGGAAGVQMDAPRAPGARRGRVRRRGGEAAQCRRSVGVPYLVPGRWSRVQGKHRGAI